MKSKMIVYCSCGAEFGVVDYEQQTNTFSFGIDVAAIVGKHVRLGHSTKYKGSWLYNGN